MNCWFCSLRDAQDRHACGIDMYGDVDTRKSESQTDIAYRVRHIEVPRCEDCHRQHRQAGQAQLLAVVLAVVAAVAVLAIILSWTAPLVSGIWLGLSLGLALAALLASVLVQKGIQPLRKSRSRYPEVQELLKQCYRFGRRPRADIPKSSKPCANPPGEEIRGG